MAISASEDAKAISGSEETKAISGSEEAMAISGSEDAIAVSGSEEEASQEEALVFDLNNYEKIEDIGEGSFGSVYKAKDLRTGEIVAVKKVKQPVAYLIKREIEILQKLKHENIIRLKEASDDKDELETYLVFEFMHSDLATLAEKTTFTPANIKYLMNQLLSGLEYCHQNQVLHRDIKGANILVDEYYGLKLVDFGSSRSLQEDPGEGIDPVAASILGDEFSNEVTTLAYRPPELLIPYSTQYKYGGEVDIWSAGCVFAGLLGNTRGKAILPGKNDNDQLELIFELCGSPNNTNWPGVSVLKQDLKSYPRRVTETYKSFGSDASDLLNRMLVLNPLQRISAEEALGHPYFTQSITTMDLSLLTEALADKSFDKIAHICDTLMRQVASEGISFHDDWPYAVHLLGHLYVYDCDSARILWEKIPTRVKESKPEVVAAWRICQLWERDDAGVYEAIRGYDWSEEAKGLVTSSSGVLHTIS